MISVRYAVLAIVYLSVTFACADTKEAEKRLRYWLQQPDERGGVFSQGKLDGVDYRKLLQGAVAYDRASLRDLFRYTANGKLMGEGADTNCEILHHLLEIWGDSRFATVLSQEPARVRVAVIAAVDYDYPHWRPTAYPKTYRLATHEKF